MGSKVQKKKKGSDLSPVVQQSFFSLFGGSSTERFHLVNSFKYFTLKV